jgi:hypothetical protein
MKYVFGWAFLTFTCSISVTLFIGIAWSLYYWEFEVIIFRKALAASFLFFSLLWGAGVATLAERKDRGKN